MLRREFSSLGDEKRITDDDNFPAFLREHAALMDADADGKLSEGELESYLAELLPARVAASSGRVIFRDSPTLMGLFAYLDENNDSHLSERELAKLKDILAALDADKDQKLSQAEIPFIVRIALEREMPGLPYLSPEQQNAGPPWFYRLDRNQDGVLTPEEFPGGRALFDRLDPNRDQIITWEEALAADAKFRDASSKQEN